MRAQRDPFADGLDRAEALAAPCSPRTPCVRVGDGRFALAARATAPRRRERVNTFPVLATDADDALLGAAIVLPDHPQIAPESRGDLFDGTEIEEALLLHVLALSDGEREQIAGARPRRARDDRARRRGHAERDPRACTAA